MATSIRGLRILSHALHPSESLQVTFYFLCFARPSATLQLATFSTSVDIIFLPRNILTLSLPVTRICVNYSTVYNDTLVAKGLKILVFKFFKITKNRWMNAHLSIWANRPTSHNDSAQWFNVCCRYPVIVNSFSLNPGSGGSGRFKGGDGIVRELLFRKPLTLSVLSERRVHRPYGLFGRYISISIFILLMACNHKTLNLQSLIRFTDKIFEFVLLFQVIVCKWNWN